MSAPVSRYLPRSEDPGNGLGIASFILALCGFSILPLILGLVAMGQSRQAGVSNGFALAGVIIASVEVAIIVIGALFLIGVIGVGLRGS